MTSYKTNDYNIFASLRLLIQYENIVWFLVWICLFELDAGMVGSHKRYICVALVSTVYQQRPENERSSLDENIYPWYGFILPIKAY